MTDIVERLRRAGSHLGDAIAGYRDDNFERSAKGLADTATLVLDAADEIERMRVVLNDIDELVEDYADADDGQPNLAMRVMMMVRAVITPRWRARRR